MIFACHKIKIIFVCLTALILCLMWYFFYVNVHRRESQFYVDQENSGYGFSKKK